MKIAVFNTKSYDKVFLDQANKAFGHDIKYFKTRLTNETLPSAAATPVSLFL